MPPVRNVRSSQSKRIGLATASGGQQEVQHQATTPRWTQSAALSHNIGDAPIPPYLVWAAQNRLVPPLALLTEDALEALATDSALWTTHSEFDDLEGRDAPRRRCSNANCFDAWLPWTWADEALQFETFMSAFAKLVLLVRETLCTDAGARAAVQADTDQFIRQVSMRLRRPGNWRFIRRPVIDAVGTWRQQISQGVPWHENLLAQIGSDQIDEGLRCVTMHGREWPLSDHKPHGDTWPEIVESVLGFWRDKCECRQEGTRSATSIPMMNSDVPKRRTVLLRANMHYDDLLTIKLAETTKFAKLKRVLARRYNRNPFHIGVSLDGLRLRDQTCLAELLRGDEARHAYDAEEELEVYMHQLQPGGL